jgi:N-acetyl-1-D-myo-inositol-2-amino-2-deoxy-alpha-D-glucopyranoside deacetylase
LTRASWAPPGPWSAIQRAATAAFFASGVLGSDAPERLFYAAMAREVFLEFAEASRGRSFVDGLDPNVFSTSAEMIAVTFDARPYVERKLAALTAHRSAFGVTTDILKNPPPPVAQMLRAFLPIFEREVLVLGGTRGAVRRWPLDDFFDGLETADLRAVGAPAVAR